MTCPACRRRVSPESESYFRDGWHDSCAQTDLWAKGPAGRRVLCNAEETAS
mgnify:CR=1 FL=1